MLTLALKYKMDLSVVAATFFSLRMLTKRRPGCYMNKNEKYDKRDKTWVRTVTVVWKILIASKNS